MKNQSEQTNTGKTHRILNCYPSRNQENDWLSKHAETCITSGWKNWIATDNYALNEFTEAYGVNV